MRGKVVWRFDSRNGSRAFPPELGNFHISEAHKQKMPHSPFDSYHMCDNYGTSCKVATPYVTQCWRLGSCSLPQARTPILSDLQVSSGILALANDTVLQHCLQHAALLLFHLLAQIATCRNWEKLHFCFYMTTAQSRIPSAFCSNMIAFGGYSPCPLVQFLAPHLTGWSKTKDGASCRTSADYPGPKSCPRCWAYGISSSRLTTVVTYDRE